MSDMLELVGVRQKEWSVINEPRNHSNDEGIFRAVGVIRDRSFDDSWFSGAAKTS